jgi:hypothetical protein
MGDENRRDDIEAAISGLQGGEEAPQSPVEAPQREIAPAPSQDTTAGVQRLPRDESGRFKAAADDKPYLTRQRRESANIPRDTGTAPAPPEPGGSPAPGSRAPASWSPSLREQWSALPAPIQEHIARREAEITRTIGEAQSHKQIADAFRQQAAPYAMLLQMEGADPAQAFGQYLYTAAKLRTGTPQERAGIVVGLIQRFGIDVQQLDRMLAQALNGQPTSSPQAAPPQGQYQDPRVDQILAALHQAQSQQHNQLQQEARSELDGFRDKAEFYEDLRSIMADALEMAANRGQAMSLQEAYDLASQMHPDVRQVLANRNVTSRARTARASSVSVAGGPTAPAGAVPASDGTRRGDILAAIAALNSR